MSDEGDSYLSLFLTVSTNSNTEINLNAGAEGSADEKITMITPEGNYSDTALIINMPNGDILNNATFKSIRINEIASDTWIERAKRNLFIIDASAGHVVISQSASIAGIQIIHNNSNFVLDVKGSVEKISVESKASVAINVTGTVEAVEVKEKATITIGGSSKLSIPITVGSYADGTLLTSKVALNVTTNSNTEVNLSVGAEGSKLASGNKDKSVVVTNNTNKSVTIDNPNGKKQNVDSGKSVTVDGTGKVTNNTTGGIPGGVPGGGSGGVPTGGGSTSGGSVPTGDSSKMIEYHDEYAKGIGVKLYESSSGTYGYYAVTNNTKDRVMFCLDYRYTDSDGKTYIFPQIFLESLEPGQTRFERITALPAKNTRVIASAQNIGLEKASVNKEIGYEKKKPSLVYK